MLERFFEGVDVLKVKSITIGLCVVDIFYDCSDDVFLVAILEVMDLLRKSKERRLFAFVELIDRFLEIIFFNAGKLDDVLQIGCNVSHDNTIFRSLGGCSAHLLDTCLNFLVMYLQYTSESMSIASASLH